MVHAMSGTAIAWTNINIVGQPLCCLGPSMTLTSRGADLFLPNGCVLGLAAAPYPLCTVELLSVPVESLPHVKPAILRVVEETS